MFNKNTATSADAAVRRLEDMLVFDKHELTATLADTMKEDIAAVVSEYLRHDCESDFCIPRNKEKPETDHEMMLVCKFYLKKQ
jgi:septum formation topological specificity factor MinE